MKLIRHSLFIILLIGLILGLPVSSQETTEGKTGVEEAPAVSEAENLRAQIEAKSAELQALQIERERIEKNIESLGRSSNTLSKELKMIDYQIKQLDLSIKSNKIILEKLELEINSLDDEIDSIEENIANTKSAIVRLFIEMQQKDKESILTLILRNQSLTASVAEAQSIVLLNNALADKTLELRDFQQDLIQKLKEQKNKKKTKEIEKTNLLNRQYIIQDQKIEKEKILTRTKNQEKIYQQELKDLVKKQLEISEEIEKIESELRSKIDPNLLPIPRPGVLEVPVAGAITQRYGRTKFAVNGYRGQFHNGVDLGAPFGTPVLAAEDGEVIMTADQDKYCPKGAYGRLLVVKHENNLTTLYAHLSRIAVSKGQKVERGDVLGYVGQTGYATGPHLHFTVYAGPTFYIGTSKTCGLMPFGGDLDPLQYLAI